MDERAPEDSASGRAARQEGHAQSQSTGAALLRDNGVIFHITCKNFRVETVGAIPFDDKVVVIAQIAPQETGPVTAAIAGDRLSVHDVAPNIRGVLAEEIAELRQQGIEVDDDN